MVRIVRNYSNLIFTEDDVNVILQWRNLGCFHSMSSRKLSHLTKTQKELFKRMYVFVTYLQKGWNTKHMPNFKTLSYIIYVV